MCYILLIWLLSVFINEAAIHLSLYQHMQYMQAAAALIFLHPQNNRIRLSSLNKCSTALDVKPAFSRKLERKLKREPGKHPSGPRFFNGELISQGSQGSTIIIFFYICYTILSCRKLISVY